MKIEDIELALEITNNSIQQPFTLRDAATIWLNCLQNHTYVRHLLVSILRELEQGAIQMSALPSEFVMRKIWTLPQTFLYLYSNLHTLTAQQSAPDFMHCLPEFSFQENTSERCLLMVKQYFKCNAAQLGGNHWLTLEQLTKIPPSEKESHHLEKSVAFSKCANIVLVDSADSRDSKSPNSKSQLLTIEARLLKHNTLQCLFDEASIELNLLKYFKPSFFSPHPDSGTVVVISCAGSAIFAPKKGHASLVIGTSKSANISLHKVCPTAAMQHLVLSYDTDKSSSLMSNIGYEQSVLYTIYKPGFKSTALDIKPGGKLFFNQTHNYEHRPVMIAVYIYSFPLLIYSY